MHYELPAMYVSIQSKSIQSSFFQLGVKASGEICRNDQILYSALFGLYWMA